MEQTDPVLAFIAQAEEAIGTSEAGADARLLTLGLLWIALTLVEVNQKLAVLVRDR